MAFTSTITDRSACANLRIHYGTWTTDTTGGDINTGLRQVVFMALTPKTTAPAEQCAVDETLPCDGSAVTIAVTSGADGYWLAFGY